MQFVKSLFGSKIDSLQAIVDQKRTDIQDLWYPKYFRMANPQVSLTFISVIGHSRVEAAATVVDRDAETPLRSRAILEKYKAEIPSIREMIAKKESDLRDYLEISSMEIYPQLTKEYIQDLIWNDIQKVGRSVFMRIDMMVLEGLSTGKISLSTLNNPDGIVLSNEIDLLMPSENKIQAAISWNSPSTALPLVDIEDAVKSGSDKAVKFDRILMSTALFKKMIATDEVTNAISANMAGYVAEDLISYKPILSISTINGFLKERDLPMIELVDKTFGIEKDGKIQPYKPFNENNLVFVPAGNLGRIRNAYSMEELNPVNNIMYSKLDQALISKWSTQDPLNEFTKAELNAFPEFERIDSCFIMEASL